LQLIDEDRFQSIAIPGANEPPRRFAYGGSPFRDIAMVRKQQSENSVEPRALRAFPLARKKACYPGTKPGAQGDKG
jgi:hypothetical protein